MLLKSTLDNINKGKRLLFFIFALNILKCASEIVSVCTYRCIISLQRMLRPFPPLISKKTCFSTGMMKYFIETFRALGVARGHSSYKLTKSVSLYSSVRKSSCQVH